MKIRIAAIFGLFFALSGADSLYGQFGRLSENFGVNKIQWNVANCDWDILSTPRNSIYYCRGGRAIAEAALVLAETSYDTLKNIFGVEPKNPRRTIVYLPGQVQETNTWPGFVPENVGGWYEDENNLERTVTPFNGDYNWFRCLERHERVHNFQGAITRKFIPEGDMRILHYEYGVPLWWTEGEAEYRSDPEDRCRGIDRDIFLRDLVLTDRLPTFRYLSEYPWGIEHYIIGSEAHRYLADSLGKNLNLLFYQNLGAIAETPSETKDAFAIAFQKTYMDFDEFYLRFKHSLRLKYYPQYNGLRLPVYFGMKPLPLPPEKFLSYSAPIELYEVGSKTYVIFYSGYDGFPTLYRVEVGGDSVPQIVVRGGRSGYEDIDPLIDVFEDSLAAISAKNKGFSELVIRNVKRNVEVFRKRFGNIPVINSPHFSPDGKRLVFSGPHYSSQSDSSGPSDLFLYDREKDALERLTQDIYLDEHPRWQPNGNWIVFESDRGEGAKSGYTNLFLINAETKEIRYLTRGPWHDFYPNWSHDGKRVIFTSDREGFYDLHEMDLLGHGRRLTKYFGSALFGHYLPDDRGIIFVGLYEGQRRIGAEMIPPYEVGPEEDGLERDSLAQRWSPTWRWEGRESPWYKDVTEKKYTGEYRVEGFCGGELAAGYGYGTACGVMIPDFFDDHWFFASFGKMNYSWVPGVGRFNANVGFTDLGKRNDYSLFLYYEDNPAIDIPIRHAYTEKTFGGGGVLFHPFSKYFRLENFWGLEYLNQQDLYDWTNPYDLNHATDTLSFRMKGLTLRSGFSFVGNNALGIASGPVVGYSYRVGAFATTNLSGLVPRKSYLSDFPGLSEESGEKENFGALVNYTLHADLRHYARLGLISTLGLRFYGYYSGGKIPTYVSFGKLNGMAAFYPWNSPYGSRGWMANSRITLPVIRSAKFEMPILGTISFSGIQGEFFFDLAQTWFRNNNPGPIYCDLGARIKVPFGITDLQFDFGKMCVLPLKSGYELPEFYRTKKFGVGFGRSF